jgi:hypothetical protein
MLDESHHLARPLARVELAAARASGGARRDALLASAERRARAIEREGMRWSSTMACALRPGGATLAATFLLASALYVSASATFGAAEMKLHAASACFRAASADAKRRALDVFRDDCVRVPERFAAMLAPPARGGERRPRPG